MKVRKQVQDWTNFREEMEKETMIITLKEKMLRLFRSVLDFSVNFGP